MGEHNIDVMYKRQDEFMKELQRLVPSDSLDFDESSEKQEMLDILMKWEFTKNKVKVKERTTLEIDQDEVELLYI